MQCIKTYVSLTCVMAVFGPGLMLLAFNVLVEAVEPVLRRHRLVEVLHRRMDHVIRPDST